MRSYNKLFRICKVECLAFSAKAVEVTAMCQNGNTKVHHLDKSGVHPGQDVGGAVQIGRDLRRAVDHAASRE